MGYTTYFSGWFEVSPPLAEPHKAYLLRFSQTRRMERDPNIAATLPDPCRVACGLPLESGAAYFVGAGGSFGQLDDPSVLSYNEPPLGQPGLWCQWVPTDDGTHVEWDGGEKFYAYTDWLRYLVDHFLSPWGYELNGEVAWDGEDSEDRGIIRATNNTIHELFAPSLDDSIASAAAITAIAQLLNTPDEAATTIAAITEVIRSTGRSVP